MALGLFLKILLLLGLAGGGGFLSFLARKYGVQGLELWLPLAIIISYGISPVIGLIVSAVMVIVSFGLFPYQLNQIGVILVCLAITSFMTLIFPVTSAAAFISYAMYLTIGYNIVSNLTMLFTGTNPLNLVKFAVISLFFSWFIYIKAGWWLVTLLQ